MLPKGQEIVVNQQPPDLGLSRLRSLSRAEGRAQSELEPRLPFVQFQKTKAIRKMVDKLCKEIRLDVDALVDAFAIPKASLAAPIAF